MKECIGERTKECVKGIEHSWEMCLGRAAWTLMLFSLLPSSEGLVPRGSKASEVQIDRKMYI